MSTWARTARRRLRRDGTLRFWTGVCCICQPERSCNDHHHFDYAQGYLISRPLASEDVPAFLGEANSLLPAGLPPVPKTANGLLRAVLKTDEPSVAPIFGVTSRGREIAWATSYHLSMGNRKRRGRPPHNDILTPAEWRVTHSVQHGMTNRQIAERRGISSEGVKFHIENVLGKLGLPNRKRLRAWFQPPKDSALHRQVRVAMGDFKLGAIGQISRSASDIKRAERWYSEVLGLQHLYTFGNMAFFDCSGTRLVLTQSDSPSAAESILYFRVPDIAQAHNRMKERGVEFTNAPHMVHRHADGTEEWMAFFKDPESRPMAIMSQAKA